MLCYLIYIEAQHERKNQNHQQHSGLCPQSQRRASLPLPFLQAPQEENVGELRKELFQVLGM